MPITDTYVTARREVCGITLETDTMEYPLSDRVFPLFEDENLLLADLLKELPPTESIDVGTGSGLLGLVVASRGGRVVAGDINRRALEFARRNALRNGLTGSIELIESDAYLGLRVSDLRRRPRLIVSNPPFVPLPDSFSFHTAGHGGPYGLRLIRPLIEGARSVMSPQGLLLFTALSLETKDEVLVASEARKHFSKVRVERIYPESIDLGRFFVPFGASLEAHVGSLQAAGFRSVGYYLFACAMEPIADLRLPKDLEGRFAGGWSARADRYAFWRGIDQSERWPPSS